MTTPRIEAAPGDSELPAWLRPWLRFWFAPIDPTGLGFIRICCGLLLLYNHLLYCYDFNAYLGQNSYMDPSVQHYIRKEVAVPRPPGDWTDWANPVQNPQNLYFQEKGSFYWSIFFHVQDPNWAVVIHVAVFGVLLLFTAGLWTRVTSVLAWAASIQYIHRLTFHLFGMDTMLIILVLYLMIGDSGGALSLDRWLERRRARARGEDAALKPSSTATLAIRLIQIHFCVIYLTSGTSKLLGSSWWNGTALWSCLDNYNFAPMRVGLYRSLLTFLCQHFWLWQIALTGSAVYTLFTEIGFPFLVWYKKLRPFMVACSVFMHLGIGLLMGLVTFSLFMLAMVLAFVPPDQMRCYVDGLRGWLAGLRSRKAPPLPEAAKDLVLTRT